MELRVAQTAGFCFGVRRAVDLAEKLAKTHEVLYCYGEIIHNMHEIHRLAQYGVKTALRIDEIPDGAPVLIRAHGVPKAVYDAFDVKGCTVFDATCPFVSKIHKIVSEEYSSGRKIIILGSSGHPEVVGIAGWCRDSLVFETPEALSEALDIGLIPTDAPISVVGQTTLNRSLWDISVKILKKGVQPAKYLIQYVMRRTSAKRRLVYLPENRIA